MRWLQSTVAIEQSFSIELLFHRCQSSLLLAQSVPQLRESLLYLRRHRHSHLRGKSVEHDEYGRRAAPGQQREHHKAHGADQRGENSGSDQLGHRNLRPRTSRTAAAASAAAELNYVAIARLHVEAERAETISQRSSRDDYESGEDFRFSSQSIYILIFLTICLFFNNIVHQSTYIYRYHVRLVIDRWHIAHLSLGNARTPV